MKRDIILAALTFFPMLAAVIEYFVGRRKPGRAHLTTVCLLTVQAAITVATVILCWGDMLNFRVPFWNMQLTLGGVHGLSFRGIYVIILNLMWLVAGVFSPEYFRNEERTNRYYAFMLATLGATCGMFMAADLLTLFTFFEIMSLCSYTWVAHTESKSALRASQSYLAVAVLGGMVALYGIMTLQNEAGTLMLSELPSVLAGGACSRTSLMIAACCLLFGFGAKAGMFPLHFWLPQSHPAAPAPASALLSGALTKAGIFGIMIIAFRLLPGDDTMGAIILILGAITMVLGAVEALLSANLKQILACSSMSQIGFILVGIGMQVMTDLPLDLSGSETVPALGVTGAVLHMMNHSLFKLVLFIFAGICYANTHSLDLNKLRGFGRGKPWLLCIFLAGALGITGTPLFSGYVSKAILHESIVEYAAESAAPWLFKALEWIFLASGGMTVAYMTKIFVAVFVEKGDEDHAAAPRRGYARLYTKILLALPALMIPLMGCLPQLIMNPASRIAALSSPLSLGRRIFEYPEYASWECLSGTVISYAVGAAVYFLVIRRLLMKDGRYVDRFPKRFTLEDTFYRPILCGLIPDVVGAFTAIFGENRILKNICHFCLKGAGAVSAWLSDLPSRCGFILRAASAVSNAASGLTDRLFDLLGATLYRETKAGYGEYKRDKLGRLVGKILDKARPGEESHVEQAVAMEQELSRSRRIITGSFSFALMMACIGLALILVYVLFLNR